MSTITNNYTATRESLEELFSLIEASADTSQLAWLKEQIGKIDDKPVPTKLFITYSLIGKHMKGSLKEGLSESDSAIISFIISKNADLIALSRVYLLIYVLLGNDENLKASINKIFETGDTGEVSTLLRFLVLFPEPELFKEKAVDAVRTNIEAVFNAIALDNPYPAIYFDELQWNQLYLKCSFMGQAVEKIMYVDERANAELARAISDVAHERWSAGRPVNPLLWRITTKFLNERIKEDLKKLFESENISEVKAACLVAYKSQDQDLCHLADDHSWLSKVQAGELTWETLV